jgi:hypothetical protein
MYTEYIGLKDTQRVKEFVDPEGIYLSDEDIMKTITICGGLLDRVIVKCLLGIEQKAKERKLSADVDRVRILRGRFEAGIVQV